jgi:hypothetical protein
MVNEETAKKILSAINVMGLNEKEIAESIANDHPTLQQTFMNICIGFINAESKKTYADGRNQATVDLAKKIVSHLDYEDVEGRLPFI